MARSNKKRESILSAAIVEFKQNGYEATSMDQISLTAQVSKRTVYNHFPSKDILFDAIIMQMLAFFTAAVSIQYNPQSALADQLTDIGEQEMALLCNPSFVDLAKVCLAEAMHNPERINKALSQVEDRDGSLASWITAATEDKRLTVTDVQFAVTQFFGLIKAFCFWPQMVHGQSFPDATQQSAIIKSTVTMFLGLYQVVDYNK